MTLSAPGGDTRKRKLTLEGSATQCADKEMPNILFDAMQGCDHLQLDVSQLTEVDLSFLLLLCAIHRMSRQYGKTFRVSGKLPLMSGKVAAASWVVREGTCLFASSKRCILTKLVPDFANH